MLAIVSEDETSDTVECLLCKKLDLVGVVVGLHQAIRMHLHLLGIDGLRSEVLIHLKSVSRAVLTVDCGKEQQIRVVLCKQ